MWAGGAHRTHKDALKPGGAGQEKIARRSKKGSQQQRHRHSRFSLPPDLHLNCAAGVAIVCIVLGVEFKMPPRKADYLAVVDDMRIERDDVGKKAALTRQDTEATTSCASSSASTDTRSRENGGAPSGRLSPTTVLCLLVMLDMFSVSLVVPLLHQYYKSAGISSASQREMLSSLFSSSQIAGGLILGFLSDLGVLSRRNILFLSFLGSAVSYALIVVGGLKKLILSRVLVGLVKQTMTVSTSLLAKYTTSENRAVHMGRLQASTTVAWIVGPSVGALLFKHVDSAAPALAACGLFVVNSILAALLLPRDDGMEPSAANTTKTKDAGETSKSSSGGKFSSFFANLRSCFSSPKLAAAVISLLLLGWVQRTTSYANMASFYEEKYGVEPHQRGYISSYQQCLNFLVQSLFIRALLSAAGGERRAAFFAASCVAVATLIEIFSNFSVFACVVCPLVAASLGMLGLSLRSLVTQTAPKESLGSVLAALDVLHNAASVTVPFYRTFLFSIVKKLGEVDTNAAMAGDPEPRLWLLSSFMHWAAFASVLGFLLLVPSYRATREEKNGLSEKKRQ